MTLLLHTESTAAAVAVGDPDGTRAVTSIIALLVALGLALLMVAVWLYRSTRPDPELLAPLEAMGERRWRRRDPVWQRRRLDELRPPGAEPIEPIAAPPEVDEAFERGPTASGFDDLHDAHDGADGAAGSNGTRPGGTSIDGSTDASVDESTAARTDASGDDALDEATRLGAADTPVDTERPLDQLPDSELDAETLQAALEQIDAELRRSRFLPRPSTD